MELWYPHIRNKSRDELLELAGHCAARNLRVTVLAPYFSFTRGVETWKKSLETAEDVLAAARIFEVKKVRTFIDVGRDGLPSRNAGESHWDAARKGLKELCSLDRSVEFVVETHENTLADTLPSVQRILDEVAESNLKLNYQSNRDFIKRGYLECLKVLWPKVAHMHWQQILPEGEESYVEVPGLINFQELKKVLADRNYDGSASVEYCWLPVEASRLASAARFLSCSGPD